ncbi:hypothetical protein ACWDRB_62965 [Nonomuraea sp. NPDC003707]
MTSGHIVEPVGGGVIRLLGRDRETDARLGGQGLAQRDEAHRFLAPPASGELDANIIETGSGSLTKPARPAGRAFTRARAALPAG